MEKSLALPVLVVTLPICHTTLLACGGHQAHTHSPAGWNGMVGPTIPKT